LNEQRGKARQDKDGWSDEGGEPLPLPLPLQSKAKAKANIGMSVQKNGKWRNTLSPNNTLPERDKSAKQIYRFNT
jgi:hypothetical protein